MSPKYTFKREITVSNYALIVLGVGEFVYKILFSNNFMVTGKNEKVMIVWNRFILKTRLEIEAKTVAKWMRPLT